MGISGALLNRTGNGLALSTLLGKPQSKERIQLSTKSAIAALYTAPNGVDHWITSDQYRSESTAYLRREGMDGTLTTVHDETLPKVVKAVSEIVTRTSTPLSALIVLGKAGVPIMTPKTLELLDSSNHYRATIADMMILKDLTNVAVLVHVSAKKGDTSQIKIPSWIEGVRWLSRKWFACETVDSAVSIKMASPQATIIEL